MRAGRFRVGPILSTVWSSLYRFLSRPIDNPPRISRTHLDAIESYGNLGFDCAPARLGSSLSGDTTSDNLPGVHPTSRVVQWSSVHHLFGLPTIIQRWRVDPCARCRSRHALRIGRTST